jgi:hypothetical protein
MLAPFSSGSVRGSSFTDGSIVDNREYRIGLR